MKKSQRTTIIKLACEAFQPRVMKEPCRFPDCACKGPPETADGVIDMLWMELSEALSGQETDLKRDTDWDHRAVNTPLNFFEPKR